jgi:hypothetical protein
MKIKIANDNNTIFSSELTESELAELMLAAEKIKKRSWSMVRKWVAVSALHFGVDPEKVIKHCRQGILYRARSIVMFHLHTQGLSYVAIGKFFKKDHATVIYNVSICKKKFMKDYELVKQKVETIPDDVFEDSVLLEQHVNNPNVTFTFPNSRFVCCPRTDDYLGTRETLTLPLVKTLTMKEACS